MHKTGIYFLFLILLTACERKESKKGSELQGRDAVTYLAGSDQRTWKLQSGHDYYEYILFDNKGKAIHQSGEAIKYKIDGAKLSMLDFKQYDYTILEISDKKLTMLMDGQDTLVYQVTEEKPSEGKIIGKLIDAKWLKGKYGTTWKFRDADKVYSFMNDGRILNALTKEKVDKWSVDSTTFNFGSTPLMILRLTPIYFDYDAWGETIELNYISEANADGTPRRPLAKEEEVTENAK